MLGYSLSRKIVPAQQNIFSEQLFLSSSEVTAQVKFSSRPEQLREHRDRPLVVMEPVMVAIELETLVVEPLAAVGPLADC